MAVSALSRNRVWRALLSPWIPIPVKSLRWWGVTIITAVSSIGLHRRAASRVQPSSRSFILRPWMREIPRPPFIMMHRLCFMMMRWKVNGGRPITVADFLALRVCVKRWSNRAIWCQCGYCGKLVFPMLWSTHSALASMNKVCLPICPWHWVMPRFHRCR